MNQKLIGKHTIQFFKRAKKYACVFSMACAGACKCDGSPFPSMPDYTITVN